MDQVFAVIPSNNWVKGHRGTESRVRTLRVQKLGLGQGLTRAGNLGGRHLESVRLKIGSELVWSVCSAGQQGICGAWSGWPLAGLDILIFSGSPSVLASSVGGLRMLALGASGHGRGPAFPQDYSLC